MPTKLKKVLSLVLCLALVATLGASAFADGPKDTGKDNGTDSTTQEPQSHSKPENHPKEDEKPNLTDDEAEFEEDMDDAFTFDMSEIFDQIEDPEERANVEALYEEYMQAYEEEEKAYDNLITAEDAFFDALESAKMKDDDTVKPEEGDASIPSDDEVEDTPEEAQEMSLNEVLDMLMQFISWYNSINNNSDNSDTTQPSSSQPPVDAQTMS